MPEMNLTREPDYRELVQRLFARTREGKVQWRKASEAGSFEVAISDEFFFTVTANYLLLKNKDSESVAYISISDPNHPAEVRDLIPTLHKLASRLATRDTEQIDKAIAFLGNL
jgi:hypothetical protein